MKIEKAVWGFTPQEVRAAVPITKIDRERRLVHGFASLNNADSQDDVVLAEASQRAFQRFRGNIREMHQPIAVGKMVDFRDEVYFDPQTEKFYDGLYVTVYVSKGAQSTWEKVLDGTLTGFSIGGNIIEAESEFDQATQKMIRFVKDYDLFELSLVDNPANQLANIFSFEKMASGQLIMKGMVADTKSETVFYCTTDEIAKTSTEESLDCPNCGNTMATAGWFEYDSNSDRTEKVAEVVQKYLSSNNNEQEVPANNKGGVDVAKDTVTKTEEAPAVESPASVTHTEETSSVESTETEVAATVDETAATEEKSEEEAASVSEVDSAEDDLAKMFDSLKENLEKSVADGIESVNLTLGEVNKKIESFSADIEKKISELSEKHGELSNKFASIKDELGKVEKSVQALEGLTAVKKSGDLGGDSDTVVEKSATSSWGGHFLGVESLKD